jgi:hypothetical protein
LARIFYELQALAGLKAGVIDFRRGTGPYPEMHRCGVTLLSRAVLGCSP